MFYPFEPASHIDDYLPAIVDHDEFVVKHDIPTGIMIINYNFVTDTTFPDPGSLTGVARRLAILRRDCRGIEFDLVTGDVVTKKYHKFFNANEKSETQVGGIDWSQSHHILEKLDGSMITPYRRKDSSYQWHTKMGATDVAEPVNRYVAACGLTYVALAEAMREDGKTPIFEWCSQQQRIIVDYPCEQLVLTAVRDVRTGTYVAYPHVCDLGLRFGIPVVQTLAHTIADIHQFLHDAEGLKDAEGYVVRFIDGHAMKVKGAWYCRIHAIKELLTLEKRVWSLLLNNELDDAKPFMQDDDRVTVEAFAAEFYARVRLTSQRLADKVTFDRQRFSSRKQFAIEGLVTATPSERKLLFRIWDGHDAWTEVVSYLVKNIGTQAAVDAVRDFVGGLAWRT